MIILFSFGFLLCFHITNIVVIDEDDKDSENGEEVSKKKRNSWIYIRDDNFKPEDFMIEDIINTL